MTFVSKVLAGLALAAPVLAHGTVTGWTVDNVFYGGFKLDYYYMKKNGGKFPDTVGWYAEDLDNGFVDPSSYQSPDIICHKNAQPAPISAKISGGGQIQAQWPPWPDSHFGPILTYVANCNGDCAKVDKTTLKWIKIQEQTLDLATQKWPTEKMIKSNNSVDFTIPQSLAAGHWVVRHEIIALHGAGSANGAQNYPQCMNIEITGSGTENPEGVLGTELYKANDPGILFQPYGKIADYKTPGPALFGSGQETTGSKSASTSSSNRTSDSKLEVDTATSPTYSQLEVNTVTSPTDSKLELDTATNSTRGTSKFSTNSNESPDISEHTDSDTCDEDYSNIDGDSKNSTHKSKDKSKKTGGGTDLGSSTKLVGSADVNKPPTKEKKPAASNSTDGSVALYGQCGGLTYSGSTTCAKGSCVKQNDYYSQCVQA